jgi:xanthine dehydrogenase accessory factor
MGEFMNTLTQEIVNQLSAGNNIILATLISQNGSTPRSTGARMIIQSDGRIFGTIGGGQLEAQSIKIAKEIFVNHTSLIKEFHLTGKDAASTDMICGGNQEVLIEYLEAGDTELLAAFQAALVDEQTRQGGWWIIQLPIKGEETSRLPRWYIGKNGKVTTRTGDIFNTNVMYQLPQVGDEKQSPEEPSILLEVDKAIINIGYPRLPQTILAGKSRFFIAPLNNYGTVYIFGAGHVSQKLAILTSMVGFRTVVLDDREEYANKTRFPGADEIIVLKDNHTALEEFPVDPDSYFVIVTRGHLHDQVILAQVLKIDSVYIGMIGSKRKRDEIYKAMEKEGVERIRLEKVHSPIGLTIGAESPEEIAVSITAELIQARVSHLKSRTK